MKDINIQSSEFIELLQEAVEVGQYFVDNVEIVERAFEIKRERTSPHSEHNKRGESNPWRHNPHWDILPKGHYSSLKAEEYDPCGVAYLEYMQRIMRAWNNGEREFPGEYNFNNAVLGFPNSDNFVNYIDLQSCPLTPADKKTCFSDVIQKISYQFLGGNSMALCALYPPGGYIPWHHNGNAPGYNILLHYSWGGDGSFYTLDGGEIIEYSDKDSQWVARAGRFLDTVGSVNSKTPRADAETASWHCAKTDSWRLTISTIIDNEDMWNSVIEELESPD